MSFARRGQRLSSAGWLAALLIAAAIVAFGAVRATAADPAAPAAADAPPLRVLAYETRPFFHRDGGKPAGFEYELLDYYARSKGRPLQLVWVADFEQVLPRLLKGEGDVAAATLTATP